MVITLPASIKIIQVNKNPSARKEVVNNFSLGRREVCVILCFERRLKEINELAAKVIELSTPIIAKQSEVDERLARDNLSYALFPFANELEKVLLLIANTGT